MLGNWSLHSEYNQYLIQNILPVYLRFVQAHRYDGVTAIVALSEAHKLYPEFSFDIFLGDGAHDNYSTYNLLNTWNISPIIPLNKKNEGNLKYPPHIDLYGVNLYIGIWVCHQNLLLLLPLALLCFFFKGSNRLYIGPFL